MFFKNRKNRKNNLEIQNNIEKNIVYRRTILVETYKKQDSYSFAFGINNFVTGHYAISYGSYSSNVS